MNKKLLSVGMIVMLIAVLLTGCKIKNYDSALININNGEDKITLGYGNFVFKYNQAMYDSQYGQQYGKALWTQDMTGSGQTFTDEVKANVIETLEYQYAIKKHADEYGVTLTDEDKKGIEEATDKFLKDNSSSALNAMGADKDVATKFFEDLTYVSKMQKAITDKGKANGEVTDGTDTSAYVSNIIKGWVDAIQFSVDEDLLKQITVDDMFATSGSADSTNSTNSTKSANSTKAANATGK